uniref:Uncharacterized protein n=1 Tax=Lactuca sativa TaxID=4236 RepID=A0A9R1XQY1_LACSA|nr:hypothetical protein LSAT_V11C300105270 [Lactuca sativa]
MPTGVECHPLPCHYLMCKEDTTFDPIDLEELLFPIGDYQVYFDRKALCLVNDLRFGDYFHLSSDFAVFRDRVFPFVPLLRSVSIEDLVRVSLLYMLEQWFLWKYQRRYLWGRLIWDFTYKQLHTLFDEIEDHLNPNATRIGSRHTYTLQGFVYAIKIWIFETFTNSSIVGSPIPGVIHRAVAYPRMRHLHAPDCERILDVTNIFSIVCLIIYKFI